MGRGYVKASRRAVPASSRGGVEKLTVGRFGCKRPDCPAAPNDGAAGSPAPPPIEINRRQITGARSAKSKTSLSICLRAPRIHIMGWQSGQLRSVSMPIWRVQSGRSKREVNFQSRIASGDVSARI
jgi:hypothetical protein